MKFTHRLTLLGIVLAFLFTLSTPPTLVNAQAPEYMYQGSYLDTATVPKGRILVGSRGQIRPLQDSILKDFQYAFVYKVFNPDIFTIDAKGNWIAHKEGVATFKAYNQPDYNVPSEFKEELDRYGVQLPTQVIDQGRIWPTYTVQVVSEESTKVPVYRLYHKGLKTHLYTTDANENTILAGRGWRQEGVAWIANNLTGQPVYRLYHSGLKVHHYTKDKNEYAVLASRGWRQEGTSYLAKGEVPVYRLYHAGLKKHLYTKDANEKNILSNRGWRYEGVAWTVE